MKTFQIYFAAILFCLSIICPAEISAHPILPDAKSDNCPTASFSISNNGAAAGTPINFRNESTGGNSYIWDFGDGNTSTAENPTHSYGAAGTYTVKLTVIGNGCTVEFIGTEDLIAG